MSVEILRSAENVIKLMDANLSGWPHPRISPEDMQRLAFGEILPVTEEQRDELIWAVRALRPQLRILGKTAEDDPLYRGKGHERFWLQDLDTDENKMYRISHTPHAWEQSAGYGREQYSKFGISLNGPHRRIKFDLNFNNSYDLLVKDKDRGWVYEISKHPRALMTRHEYGIVGEIIFGTAEHLGILPEGVKSIEELALFGREQQSNGLSESSLEWGHRDSNPEPTT